jgi:hypothetical protein
MAESLRQIKGFEGYFITKDGRIWSARQSGKWLKPSKGTNGYLTVGLRDADGERHRKYVHRLVAQTWLENPENLSQVNHKDENKSNNNVLNLEWCTPKYNSNYGTRNRRISKPVVNLDTGKRYGSITQASAATGIAYTSIYGVCAHKQHRLTAGGYRWEFERSA